TPTPEPEPSVTPNPTPTPEPTPTPDPEPTIKISELSAAADAFVDSRYPKSNYGGRNRIRVYGVRPINGLVRFDLSGLSGTVVRAKLRLYSLANSPSVAVHSIDNPWGEKTVAWSNAPAFATKLGTTGQLSSKRWVEIDVTAHVSATGRASFGLTSPVATLSPFSAREGSATLAPRLVVTTSITPASQITS
ncbi:MAG: DNRLRE domain-containing protein, partial [Actinomycetota bacterium]|nr:DNRLRE domain-containing protein [Actinomycetota bacterium]